MENEKVTLGLAGEVEEEQNGYSEAFDDDDFVTGSEGLAKRISGIYLYDVLVLALVQARNAANGYADVRAERERTLPRSCVSEGSLISHSATSEKWENRGRRGRES